MVTHTSENVAHDRKIQLEANKYYFSGFFLLIYNDTISTFNISLSNSNPLVP